MAEKNDQWFVAERTRALALMYLSHRRDLVINDRKKEDIGLEFLIYITSESDTPSLRQFGIALRGTANPVTEDHLNKALRPAMQSFQKIGQFPYPVGLLHFTMRDDEGYFTWVAEPSVAEDGPHLLVHSTPHVEKFSRDVLDRIVDQVNSWYDAFYARIAVKAS